MPSIIILTSRAFYLHLNLYVTYRNVLCTHIYILIAFKLLVKSKDYISLCLF